VKRTYQNIRQSSCLNIPEHWLKIKTIDMHTGGEPLRVIVDGFPELMGNSVLDYRRYCKSNYDYLRTALMFEPRGHADMYGCLMTPPNDDEGDFGIIFLHNEGYSTMCGHAIIAISTLAVNQKWIQVKEGDNEIKVDAPCGRITSFANVKDGKLASVRFHCVPSFVVGLDRTIHIPDVGTITYDLAYGGAFYAYVDLRFNNFDFDLHKSNYSKLIAMGMLIKQMVMEQDKEIIHPLVDDLSFLYGTIFIGDPELPGNDSRNVCIFADGEVDRCPTGSGVSGRMAIHWARNEIKLRETMSIESISNAVFKGSVVSEVDYGPYKAVIPEVQGTAHITGFHTFVMDPDDPMKNGFLLR
jgi:trans-L-3-hydroxyproline dehydratase